jgi:hypothetical protein
MLLVFGLVTGSQATPDKRLDEATHVFRILTFANSGWVSEGRKIFENSCKNCHHRDNDKGATFLHTESKTMTAWNRVFFEKYPQCARDGKWADLSPEDLQKLNDYLFYNAANNYDPNSAAGCG